MTSPQWVLPKDLMELQLGQIDLLMAMYESDGSISMDDDSTSLVNDLRSWCENETKGALETKASSVFMALGIEIDGDEPRPLKLDLSVPIALDTQAEADAASEPPRIKCRVQTPAWLSRAQASRLSDATLDAEDVLSAIENVKEAAAALLADAQAQVDARNASSTGYEDGPIVRVWFYFPSISTRAKRDDIINYAPSYGLTGFLLAGKPGILCLEGVSRAIDDYMKFIKTESWGDIPSQHKKVSERHRETDTGLKRLFEDMREITHLVGERRGERANRNDMKALEAWLEARGVSPDVFGKVLF